MTTAVAVLGQRRIAISFRQLEAMLSALSTGERWTADGAWPEDLKIQRVHVDHESDSFEVFVTSEHFQAVESGMVIPYWTPRFKAVGDVDA